jgi:hypothetical protein
MPGSTPNLNLPYPIPGDTVDVPRDVQALAAALDPIVVTASQLRAIGSFAADRAAPQSVANNTPAQYGADRESWDISGWYDAPNATYIPQVAGIYEFWCQISPGTINVINAPFQAFLFRSTSLGPFANVSALDAQFSPGVAAGGALRLHGKVDVRVPVAGADRFQLYLFQNVTNPLDMGGPGSTWGASLIGTL